MAGRERRVDRGRDIEGEKEGKEQRGAMDLDTRPVPMTSSSPLFNN